MKNLPVKLSPVEEENIYRSFLWTSIGMSNLPPVSVRIHVLKADMWAKLYLIL